MLKRPMSIATILYIIGIIMGLYLQLSIILFILVCLFITAIVYLITKKKSYIIFVFVLLIGIAQVQLLNMKYNEIYTIIESQQDIDTIQAIIISKPQEKDYKTVYEVKITKVENDIYNKLIGTQWLLYIKKSSDKNEIKYGDLVEINGEFKVPDEAKNYKGFDYKQYLKSQRLYGTITAKERVRIVACNCENIIQKAINLVSTDIESKINILLPKQLRELCIGILIGEKQYLSPDITNAFKSSNLMHLLAVSGAHVSYVILGLSIIMSKTAKKIKKVITILLLVFFMTLTGFTPSVIRACVSAILMITASFFHRKSDIYNNLSVSALITVMINPYSIFNIGFQLSYIGTMGIILLNKKISTIIKVKLKLKSEEEKHDKVKRKYTTKKEKTIQFIKKVVTYMVDLFALSISANIAILPIMAINFHTISLTFWISNILVGPIFGFIIILGYLSYIISIISINLANFISIPLEILLKVLINIAKTIAKLPLSTIIVKRPYSFELIIYYIFILFSIYHKKIPRDIKKIVCYFIVTILITGYTINLLGSFEFKIYFIDVGQGDCTLIHTSCNKNILIDGGGSENSSFDIGEKTVFPYLLNRRIDTLDYVMISHFDSDHIGGLFYILENLKVKNVIISKQTEISQNYIRLKNIIKNKKINVIIATKGERIQIDKHTYFDILFPENNMILNNGLNNNSIVAKLNYKTFSMLFMGDIEEEAEKRLLEMYGKTESINATVIKIAHHGSKTSSTQNLLDKVKPKIALIGVGKDNKFGHPNQDVIERLETIRL